VIALTWGGVTYPWSSGHVIAPLVLGLLGLGVFGVYEIYFCKPPVVSPLADRYERQILTGINYLFKVPILLRMNWTGASGYLQNFVMAVILATLSCT
jgi:hypothetical protein